MFMYEEIADSIRQSILKGDAKPVEQLATVKELCSRYHVSRRTIQRAYRVLVNEGFVVVIHGKGHYVAEELPTMTVAEVRERLEDDGPKPGEDLHFLVYEALLAVAHAGDLVDTLIEDNEDDARDLISVGYALQAASSALECIHANHYDMAA